MKKLFFWIALTFLLSSCNSETEVVKVEPLHPNLTFQEAEEKGYVVAGPPGLANVGKIELFFEDVQEKKRNSISLALYTDEGDPIYVDLDYDGELISYSYDNSWDKFGGQDKGIRRTTCTTMGKRTGPRGDYFGTEYYLTNCKENIGYSDIANKEYFLLFVVEKADMFGCNKTQINLKEALEKINVPNMSISILDSHESDQLKWLAAIYEFEKSTLQSKACDLTEDDLQLVKSHLFQLFGVELAELLLDGFYEYNEEEKTYYVPDGHWFTYNEFWPSSYLTIVERSKESARIKLMGVDDYGNNDRELDYIFDIVNDEMILHKRIVIK